jgi:hypothetical protein
MLKDPLLEPIVEVVQTPQNDTGTAPGIDFDSAYCLLIEGYIRLQMQLAETRQTNGATDGEASV